MPRFEKNRIDTESQRNKIEKNQTSSIKKGGFTKYWFSMNHQLSRGIEQTSTSYNDQRQSFTSPEREQGQVETQKLKPRAIPFSSKDQSDLSEITSDSSDTRPPRQTSQDNRLYSTSEDEDVTNSTETQNNLIEPPAKKKRVQLPTDNQLRESMISDNTDKSTYSSQPPTRIEPKNEDDEILQKLIKQTYHTQYYEDNKDAIRARHTQYYEDNKDAILAQHAQYREDNKEAIRVRDAQYRKDNKDAIRARDAQYYEDNKDTILAQQAQYREDNKEAIRARDAQYREDNKARYSQYYEDNKSTIRAQQAQYREDNKEYLKGLQKSIRYLNKQIKTEKGRKDLQQDYQKYHAGEEDLPSYAYSAKQYEKFARKHNLGQD